MNELELALMDARESFIDGMYKLPKVIYIDDDCEEQVDTEYYTDFHDLKRGGCFTGYKADGTRTTLVVVSRNDVAPHTVLEPSYANYTCNSLPRDMSDVLENSSYDFWVKYDISNDEDVAYCSGCDTYYYRDAVTMYWYEDGDFDDEYVCTDCDDDVYTCDDCGEHFWSDHCRYHEVLDRTLCDSCEDRDEYSYCEDCERMYFSDDSVYIAGEDRYVCDSCAGEYNECCRCDEYFDPSDTHDVVVGDRGETAPVCNDCYESCTVYSETHGEYISDNIEGGVILVMNEDGDWDWEYDKDTLRHEYIWTESGHFVHRSQAVWMIDRNEYWSDEERLRDAPHENYEDVEHDPYTLSQIVSFFDWTVGNRPSDVIGHWVSAVELRDREEARLRREREEQERRSTPQIYSYHGYAKHWEKHYTPADMFRYREQIAAGMSNAEVASQLLYIGWELEIDGAGENPANALKITTALGYPNNKSDEFKCSHDGSLSNGFEIISMPCTLSHHTQVYRLKEGLKKAQELGYVSHDAPPGRGAGTCGLHFHVNRDFFKDCGYYHTDGGPLPDYAFKLILLINNNKDWLLPFSRRGDLGYCNFAHVENTDKLYANDFVGDDDSEGTGGNIITSSRGIRVLTAQFHSYQGHRAALNFNNTNTVEFRFCRGTLNYTTFVASLQYIQMTCEIAKSFDLKQLCSVDLDFYYKLAEKRGYNEFIKYMNKRMAKAALSVDSVAA